MACPSTKIRISTMYRMLYEVIRPHQPRVGGRAQHEDLNSTTKSVHVQDLPLGETKALLCRRFPPTQA